MQMDLEEPAQPQQHPRDGSRQHSGMGGGQPGKEVPPEVPGSFLTAAMKSSLPLKSRGAAPAQVSHAAGGDAAPATYRNIKVLLSRRVNSSNALSKGQINTIWEHLRSLGSHIFSQAER